MVARANKIDWRLMTEPVSRGLEVEAQANAATKRSILGSLTEIGQIGMQKKHDEESKRRFGIASAREQEELDLRKKIHEDAMLEKARDRQGNDTALLDGLSAATEAITGGAAMGGEPDPQATEAFTRFTDAVGGPEVAQQRLAMRADPAKKT